MSMRKFLYALALLTIFVAAAHAGTVTLAWDEVKDSSLAGYKIYYGTSSRNYTHVDTLGKELIHVVASLPPGVWYFAATAFDVNGNESGYSNEVFTTVSGTTLVPPTITGDVK
jgi:hypothetical protein